MVTLKRYAWCPVYAVYVICFLQDMGRVHYKNQTRNVACLGLVRLGSARLGLAWLGLARLGSAWLGSASGSMSNVTRFTMWKHVTSSAWVFENCQYKFNESLKHEDMLLSRFSVLLVAVPLQVLWLVFRHRDGVLESVIQTGGGKFPRRSWQ